MEMKQAKFDLSKFILGIIFFGCSAYGAVDLFKSFVVPQIIWLMGIKDFWTYVAFFLFAAFFVLMLDKYRSKKS
jgi:hypothetical protein